VRRRVLVGGAVLAFGAAILLVAATGGWRPGAPGHWPLARAETTIDAPERHFRLEHPADLGEADAQAIYERIRDGMVGVYRLAVEEPAGALYRNWTRYNTAPYRSATHGERYVNNYANARAGAYGRFEDAGTLPVGSVLAKDSFTVTAEGDVYTGPLFLMEKMAEGFNPETRDWRYAMVMPDASLFGVTGGEGETRVRFCATCHEAAGDEADHLFFLPERYRVTP
jgi:hypothetical protein